MKVVLSWIVPVIAAGVFGFGIWATLEALRSVALGSAIGFVGFALAIGFDNPKNMDLKEIRIVRGERSQHCPNGDSERATACKTIEAPPERTSVGRIGTTVKNLLERTGAQVEQGKAA